MVGPVSLTTTPVPFRRKRARHERHPQMPNDRRASACGTATVVPLRLRSRRLSASTPLSRSPNRRPKQFFSPSLAQIMRTQTGGEILMEAIFTEGAECGN